MEQKLLHFVDAFHQYVMDRVRLVPTAACFFLLHLFFLFGDFSIMDICLPVCVLYKLWYGGLVNLLPFTHLSVDLFFISMGYTTGGNLSLSLNHLPWFRKDLVPGSLFDKDILLVELADTNALCSFSHSYCVTL